MSLLNELKPNSLLGKVVINNNDAQVINTCQKRHYKGSYHEKVKLRDYNNKKL